MLCWEGHSRSSRSSGREFQAALCFLAGNSWKAEGGKEIFPSGWIQRVGGWTLELQTSGKELGYGGRLFPALRGEIWEFFHDVEKVWIEIPALLKPGASWNPRFLLGKSLKAYPVPWTENPEHSRPGIHRGATLRLWFQQEFQVLKGIKAGYSRRSHPRTILSWWKFQQFLWSSSRSLGSFFLLFFSFFFFSCFFGELWKAFIPLLYSQLVLFPLTAHPFVFQKSRECKWSWASDLWDTFQGQWICIKKKCLEVQDFLKMREKLKEGKYPNFPHFLHPWILLFLQFSCHSSVIIFSLKIMGMGKPGLCPACGKIQFFFWILRVGGTKNREKGNFFLSAPSVFRSDSLKEKFSKNL